MKKVAFLVPLPREISPGQRFRIEQFEPVLRERSIAFDTFPFLSKSACEVLYKPGFIFRKVFGVTAGFLRRIAFLFIQHKYQYIFVFREAMPVGPPVFEWLLAKVFRKKLIFDFDDAIWIPNTSAENRLAAKIKCFWKIEKIIKWSYKISAGNDYLARYAGRYNNNVQVVPTCVDTEARFNKLKDQWDKKVVIGWTGSHSTLDYLDEIYPVIKELEKSFHFSFLVICNRPPQFELDSLIFLPWKEATEVDDLLKMNIGIMPLVQNAWSEGKCGFKIIQYLSLGIPAVASPVGVNKNIIEEGKNGFLCSSGQEWYAALAKLLQDEKQREQLGMTGRKKIESVYSIAANADRFISLFS